jgi:hypothetical protein
MKNLKLVCLMLLAVFAFASCRGPKGDPGNANVASSTVTVYASDWYWQDPSWRVDLNYFAISSGITDHGAVLVYMNQNGTWRQLPMTYFYSEAVNGVMTNFASTIEVSTYDEGVSLFWTESDLNNIGSPATHQFKIVVIASAYYSAHSDLDYSDYNTVKAFYNLAD